MYRNRRCAPAVRRIFSNVKIAKAGSVPRPVVDVASEEIRDLAYSIIRVLNRDGEAVGPWAGVLSDEEILIGLRDMMRLRAFDARMLMAQRQGKTSFYMQHLGEEAVSCAFRKALDKGDMNFPTYRQAGLLIADGYPMVEMMNQIFSNEADPLKGRQLPIMYSSKEHGFFTISGNLATQYVQAVGWAMASRDQGRHEDCRRVDRRRLDGGIRFSFRARLCLYLQGSGDPQHRQQPVGDLDLSGHCPWRLRHLCRTRSRFWHSGAEGRWQRLSSRLCGGEMGGRARARRNLGPTLIEHVTYRVGGHSTSDDPSAYRPKTESEAWPLGDPVLRLKKHLIVRGVWSEERHAQAEAEILDEVIQAQKQAESHGTLHAGGKPSVRDIFEGVYAEMPAHIRRQRQKAGY